MQRERRLGRGLGQLLSSTGSASAASPAPAPAPSPTAAVAGPSGSERRVLKVGLDKIDPNPWQPRREFKSAELEDLIASIRQNGLLQPVTVRRRGGRFELVAGERRLRAARELGWTSIDAVETVATDQQMLEWAIVENLQRADLNPMEAAAAFRRLMQEFDLTQEEAAARLGQSRSHVANTLRLLELPPKVAELVARGALSAGSARALLALDGADRRAAFAEKAVAQGLSVRAVEEMVKQARKAPPTADDGSKKADPNMADAADQLRQALSTQVEIVGSAQRGQIRITYHSSRELQGLFAKLRTLGEAGGS